MGRRVVCDIETNSLDNPTRIWCIVAKDIDSGEVFKWVEEEVKTSFRTFCGCVDHWIGHNFLAYDVRVLRSLLGVHIPDDRITDTLILSHLLKYSLEGGHSLEEWGNRLGKKKVGLDVDFSKFSAELLNRCEADVEINFLLYEYLMSKLNRPEFVEPIKVEHQIARICLQMRDDGFKFDLAKAQSLRAELDKRVGELDAALTQAFPPKAKFVREVTPRLTKHGTISRANIPRDWVDFTSLSPDATFSLIEWVPFNPGSPSQIVERLNEAGWRPTEKTKGHIEAERNKDKARLDEYKVTGWKVNEVNVATLPDYEELEDWLNWRIKIQLNDSRIKEIITNGTKSGSAQRQENITTVTLSTIDKSLLGEITGSVLPILNRCSNSNKDAARFVEETNGLWSIIVIPQGVFVDCSAVCATGTWGGLRDTKELRHRISKLKSARKLVERLLLSGRVRTLTEWIDSYNPKTGRIHPTFNAIGTWTHRMSHTNPNLGNVAAPKSIKYSGKELKEQAISLGKKMRNLWTTTDKDWYLVGTDAVGIQLRIFAHYINDERFTHALLEGDPHSLNAGILGCSRDVAKTFIYAFLLGAGDAKIGEILGLSAKAGRAAKDQYVSAFPGLQRLRKERIPTDAGRGYFQSFDGRLVACDSEHLMMAGYLQTGEAVITKHACVLWRKRLDELGIQYRQVNYVHDEYQTEVKGDYETALRVASIQRAAIAAVGRQFNLRCPMAGDSKIGFSWYDTH